MPRPQFQLKKKIYVLFKVCTLLAWYINTWRYMCVVYSCTVFFPQHIFSALVQFQEVIAFSRQSFWCTLHIALLIFIMLHFTHRIQSMSIFVSSCDSFQWWIDCLLFTWRERYIQVIQPVSVWKWVCAVIDIYSAILK